MKESENNKSARGNKPPILQRLWVASIQLILMFIVCWVFSGTPFFIFDTTSAYNLVFLSFALVIIMGRYIVEPFFTKPVGTISNCVTALVALLAIPNPSSFLLYPAFLGSIIAIILVTIIDIVLQQTNRAEKLQKVLFRIVTYVGRAEFLFSVLFISACVSYLSDDKIHFVVMMILWAIFVLTRSIERIVGFFASVKTFPKIESGDIIEILNGELYKVKINSNAAAISLQRPVMRTDTGYRIGSIIDRYKTRFDEIVEVIFTDELPNNLQEGLAVIDLPDSTSSIDKVYFIEDEVGTLPKAISDLVGLVETGSNINKINIKLYMDRGNTTFSDLVEGTILQTKIYEQEVLYQVIDGVTRNETEIDDYTKGFISIKAQKIGQYDSKSKQLKIVSWVPQMHTPAFYAKQITYLDDDGADATETVLNNAGEYIGLLPNTSALVPIRNYHELVTHNTAILGILGIGKSCLTFELVQKVVGHTDCKVVCLDITGQYCHEMREYYPEIIELTYDQIEPGLNQLRNNKAAEQGDLPADRCGNNSLYRSNIKQLLEWFVDQPGKQVLIINPAKLDVTKGEKRGYNIDIVELSIAEKTRIISEEALDVCKNKGESMDARMCLVYEEAHSLVPEWNSAASDGDSRASNGTARVILQGRKYGLGSFVITQRTANVSKSILNQCNTIFALRVFDDTGKQFLENYVGSDYANILPTLEERHAVVTGKALGLKQPIIIKLNDKKKVVNNGGASFTF